MRLRKLNKSRPRLYQEGGGSFLPQVEENQEFTHQQLPLIPGVNTPDAIDKVPGYKNYTALNVGPQYDEDGNFIVPEPVQEPLKQDVYHRGDANDWSDEQLEQYFLRNPKVDLSDMQRFLGYEYDKELGIADLGYLYRPDDYKISDEKRGYLSSQREKMVAHIDFLETDIFRPHIKAGMENYLGFVEGLIPTTPEDLALLVGAGSALKGAGQLKKYVQNLGKSKKLPRETDYNLLALNLPQTFKTDVIKRVNTNVNKTLNHLKEIQKVDDLLPYQKNLLKNEKAIINAIKSKNDKGFITLYRYGDDLEATMVKGESWFDSNPLQPMKYYHMGGRGGSGSVFKIDVPIDDLHLYYANIKTKNVADMIRTTNQEFLIPKEMWKNVEKMNYKEYIEDVGSGALMKRKGGFRKLNKRRSRMY